MRPIFYAQHDKNTLVRVVHGTFPDGSKGLDLLLNGIRRERFYNPAEATKWFEKNSKANVEKWRKAYHDSGLGADDFLRPKPAIKDIVLQVKYLSQRDNERYPGGSCNVTCLAMVLGYHGIKLPKSSYRQFEDYLEKFIQLNNRDRHSHEDLSWCARQHGLNARFTTEATMEEIRNEIRAGNPVIVSTTLTTSGHIICLIGTDGNDFIAHDPWGNFNNGYKNDHNGASVRYSGKLMQSKMKWPGSTDKWAHFISKKD